MASEKKEKRRLGARLKRFFGRDDTGEIEPPRVFAVRCRIETATHSEIPRTSARLKTRVPVTEVSTHGLAASLRADVHGIEADLAQPTIHTVSPELSTPITHAVDHAREPPAVHRGPALRRPVVRADRELARRAPFRLRLVPMVDVPKKLQIRYRAGVLKRLELTPRQVDFFGIVEGLPPAPLELMDVVTDTLDGHPIVLARQTGRFNAFMGQRVWVIIRAEGHEGYLPVALREE